MSSKNESNATYCSEVEELIKGSSALEKSDQNVPVRRSQRLLEKLNVSLAFSWNNEHVIKTGNVFKSGNTLLTSQCNLNTKNQAGKENKCTQDIFSTQDLREDQEILHSEFYSKMSCVKRIRANKDVPLDLSKKSKVSIRETSQVELDILNAANDLESCKVKNNKKAAKHNTKVVPYKTIKVTHSKRKPRKVPHKPINSVLKSDLIVTATKEFCNVQQKTPKNTYSNIEPSKSLISVKSCPNIALVELQPSELKLNSVKRTSKITASNKNIKLSGENSTSGCGKICKSSNENIATNDFKKQTKLLDKNLKTSIKPNQKIISFEKLHNEAKICKSEIPEFQDIFEKTLNETKSINRPQKMPVNDKRKYSTVELPDFIQNIKSEPFTLSWETSFNETKSKKTIQKSVNNSKSNTNSTGNKNTMETLTNKLHNDVTQIKSEKFTSLDNYSKSFSNVKSTKRSQSTTAENKHNLNVNTESNTNIISKKFESKTSSQTSSNKTKQIKSSQKSYFTRSNKKLSDEHTKKAESRINALKNQFQCVKTNFKCSNETVTSNNRNKQSDENIKTKFTSTKNNMNKNYLKSFDKTLFLEKIQCSKIYSAQNCNYDKPNLLQIPPTPAESTQDLLKTSILPDVYPPHFIYQLPPEAVLKRNLDAQTLPTYVITPDDTITSELLDSSSSSPSLPESLCELFQTKDIKDILNVEKVSYRLYDYHVQALALILNLHIDYLRKMLDKVMKIKPIILKNIDNAVKNPFVPDYDLFATTSVETWVSSGEVVLNSQSPKQRKIG